MKKKKPDEFSNNGTMPVFGWEFRYEFLNELKADNNDLKKINKLSKQFEWDDDDLEIKERIKGEVVLVTDADLKIVFASIGIKRMTGYTESEILGKTPKMFQGSETSKTTLKEIRKAIDLQISFEKTIHNYKKNGEVYKCKVNSFPVFNLKGELSHFIAFEKEDLSA